MSIAVPSDIVLDVAQAADPQRLQAATARLAQLAAAPAGTVDFGAALTDVRSSASALPSTGPSPTVPDDRPTHTQASRLSPYQKFEAMVLQNFVQSMLPKDDDLFGDAASSGAYRSMLSDQLATQLARSGKIGIAQILERAHRAAPGLPPATPHTSTTG